MINESDYRKRFGQRLNLLRKQRGLTQNELATEINYSDKAVSKWERGESVPDTYTVLRIAEFFGVSINYFFSEEDEIVIDDNKALKLKPGRLFVPLITAVGVLFLASVVFLVFVNIPSLIQYAHFPFLYASPVVAIIITVFSSLWWKMKYKCISVSAIIWTSAIAVYYTFEIENLKYIFISCAILQAVCILSYLYAYYFGKNKHNN